VYAGLDVVREHCDPASLAEFGGQLFQLWQAVGAPAQDNWVLDGLGYVGDDETLLRPPVSTSSSHARPGCPGGPRWRGR
jgi:hypothetical protein